MSDEICIQCGRQNCNGHKCDNCGVNADSPLIVDQKFYCDKFCLYSKQPDNLILSGVPASEFEKFKKRASIVGRMRELKEEARLAGVAWIS